MSDTAVITTPTAPGPARRHQPAGPRSDRPARPSPDRRRVLEPAFRPQCVEAAGDLQGRSLADIALEHFTIVADVLDDAHGPVLGEAELFAVIAFRAHHALHVGRSGGQRLIDRLLANAQLLGIEHRIMYP